MDPSRDPRTAFRGRTFRVPPGLGCLVALVTVPLALIAGLFGALLALLAPGARRNVVVTSRRTAPRVPREAPAALGATGFALCSLVEKMSLDDEFTLDDARMAGVPTDAEATIESLLDEARSRGWVEQRGERLAVTPRGRAESAALLRRMDGY